MQFGIFSDPSWKEQASVKKYENEEATCLANEVCVQMKCVCVQNVKTREIFLSFSDHNEVNSDAVTGIEEEKAQEAFNEAYALNMISTTFESDPKFHDIENQRNYKLSLLLAIPIQAPIQLNRKKSTREF